MGKSKELAELGDVVTQSGGEVTIDAALRVNTAEDNPLRFTTSDGAVGSPTWAYTEYYNESVSGPRSAYIGVTPSKHIVMGNGLGVLLRIDDYGRVTMPYQPAAFVVIDNGGSWSAFNGTIVFNDVKLNRGNHYNNANGIFTCPVDGVYRVHAEMLSGNSTSASHLFIYKNGVKVTTQGAHSNYQAGSYWTMGTEALLACSQNDQLSVYTTNSSTSAYLQSEYTKATFALLG